MNKALLSLTLLISLPTFSTNVELHPFVTEHEATAQTANGVFTGLSICGVIAFGFLVKGSKEKVQNIFKNQKAYAAFQARMQNGDFDNAWNLPFYEVNNFTRSQREKLEADHKARRDDARNQRAHGAFRERMDRGDFDYFDAIPHWYMEDFTPEQQAQLGADFEARKNKQRADADAARERDRKDEEARNERAYEECRANMENGRYDHHYFFPYFHNLTPAQRANLEAQFNARKEQKRAEAARGREEAERGRKAEEANRNYESFKSDIENGRFDYYDELPAYRKNDFTREQWTKFEAQFKARKGDQQSAREEAERDRKHREFYENLRRNTERERAREAEQRQREEQERREKEHNSGRNKPAAPEDDDAREAQEKADRAREKARQEAEIKREEEEFARQRENAERQRQYANMFGASEEDQKKVGDAWAQFPGVPRTATKKDLAKAFRGISVKEHPDRFAHHGLESATYKAQAEKFKHIQNAYDVLKEQAK